MTLEEMTNALRPLLEFPNCDLLTRLPFGSRVKSANFIEKHGDELEAMLGRRPVVERSSYTTSGRGPFGHLGGSGKRYRYRRLAVRWDS